MKNLNLQGMAIGLALAVLFSAQSARADTIELKSFWAGSGNVSINFNGIDWHDGSTVTNYNVSGGSGGFKTYDLTTDPGRTNAFQSFCVDIFHSFNFVVDSIDTLLPATIISAQAAIDLGRLFTNHHSDIASTSSSGTNESAFQLAVWEIVNEQSGSYSLSSGDFKATGTGSSLASTWLNELGTSSSSAYTANIWTVQSMLSGKGYAQDVVVFAPVPEPHTYSMLLVGFGLIAFTMRRRKQPEKTTRFM